MAEEPENQEIIARAITDVGRTYGAHDPEDLRVLGDFSTITVENGRARGVHEAVGKLKTERPHLFFDARRATPAQRQAKLTEIARGRSSAPHVPLPPDGKTAKDMTPTERAATLAEIRRRHG